MPPYPPRRLKNDLSSFHAFRKKYFPDDTSCLQYVLQARKINCCTRCYSKKIYASASRPCFACARCGLHVYPLAGTVFEKSTTPLILWFYAIFLIVETRGDTSAKSLERTLGVTYKTAWRMRSRILEAMQAHYKVPPRNFSRCLRVTAAHKTLQ